MFTSYIDELAGSQRRQDLLREAGQPAAGA